MRCALTASVVVGLLGGGSALAGNEDSVLMGDEAALLGGAVTAVASSGSALWYNPSGLAFVDRDRFDADATAFMVRVVRSPRGLRSPDAEDASANHVSLMAIPSALSLAKRFGPRFVGAVGVFVPRMVQDEVELELTARAGGRETRWALGARQQAQSYRFSVGGAWLLGGRLALGASLALAYEQVRSSVVLAGVETLGGEQDLLTLSEIAARQSFGLEARGGVGLRLGSWRLGLAVRSPALFFAHDTRSLDAVSFAVGGDRSASISSNDELDLSGAELLTQPRLRLGVAWRRGAWLFSVDGDVLFALSNDGAQIDQGHDGNARLGLSRVLSPAWTLGGGLFTDRSAARRQGGDGEDYYGGIVTVRYTNRRRLGPGEKHPQLFFTTTLGIRYAYGHGRVAGFEVATDIEATQTIQSAEQVSTTVHELALHLGSTLHF